MNKAFISILGTNDYLECRHSFNGKVSEQPVKYAQEDLIKFFCSDFNENDEIRIFLTREAKEKNWLNDGHKPKDGQPKSNKGLDQRLKALNLSCKVKSFDIKEGYNEQEIWDIFQIIYDTFREGEEIIVDITHSFRSLPMLMITMLNFAKQMKKIRVMGIYYAAFESLGPIPKVIEIPVEERIAPILDLTQFSELQDWTNATYDFVNNANIKNLRSLIKSSIQSSNVKIQKEKYFPHNVIKRLNQLIDNIALCRGDKLLKFDYDSLRNDILSIKIKDNLPATFNYLIDKIENKMRSFDNDATKLALAVVDWCFQHNLIQQAITLLQEFTFTIILNNLQKDISEKKYRNLVSQAFRIRSENISEENWKPEAKDNIELMKKLLSVKYIEDLHNAFSSLTDLRNDVNHAGFLNDSRDVDSIKSKLSNIIESYKKYLL